MRGGRPGTPATSLTHERGSMKDLERKTSDELIRDAQLLARSYHYVSYSSQLYAPTDYETDDDSATPPIERRYWKALSTEDLEEKAGGIFFTAFIDRQIYNFASVARQSCLYKIKTPASRLLIKTSQGLRVLQEDGKLHEPDGKFVPNMLGPMLNEDPDDKARVMGVITEWLGDDEELALSLLHHLATALAPHWSAGKYILLIGEGRNGKSVLTFMLQDLFGLLNCSGVTRQLMASRDSSVTALNGKLLNLVFDGANEFVKDSSTEKTLITGEPITIRRAYDPEGTVVQTNALFIEALNKEPKTSDKSAALQARLVRFKFPNRYADNEEFAAEMRSPRMLGALLSLLLDNYVLPEQKAVMLAPTSAARQLAQDYMLANSLPLQYLLHLAETCPVTLEEELVGEQFSTLASQFQRWRKDQGDILPWDEQRLYEDFAPLLEMEKQKAWVTGKPVQMRVWHITGFRQDTLDLLASHKEEEDVSTPMVED